MVFEKSFAMVRNKINLHLHILINTFVIGEDLTYIHKHKLFHKNDMFLFTYTRDGDTLTCRENFTASSEPWHRHVLFIISLTLSRADLVNL